MWRLRFDKNERFFCRFFFTLHRKTILRWQNYILRTIGCLSYTCVHCICKDKTTKLCSVILSLRDCYNVVLLECSTVAYSKLAFSWANLFLANHGVLAPLKTTRCLTKLCRIYLSVNDRILQESEGTAKKVGYFTWNWMTVRQTERNIELIRWV